MPRHTPGQAISKTFMFLGAIRHGNESADSIGSRYDGRWDGISDKAQREAQRLADAHIRAVESLRNELAAARVDLRNARNGERSTARQMVRGLETRVRRAEREARKAGVRT